MYDSMTREQLIDRASELCGGGRFPGGDQARATFDELLARIEAPDGTGDSRDSLRDDVSRRLSDAPALDGRPADWADRRPDECYQSWLYRVCEAMESAQR